MPHLHLPGWSDPVLHMQLPPQLQKLMPVLSKLTRLTLLPQPHIVGSSALSLHLQPSWHWQIRASFPSTLRTWPHLSSLSQAHLPGLVLTVLHLHSGPQSQAYSTSCRSAGLSVVVATTYPTQIKDRHNPSKTILVSFIAISCVRNSSCFVMGLQIASFATIFELFITTVRLISEQIQLVTVWSVWNLL
mgnify:CR=1 FL=1